MPKKTHGLARGLDSLLPEVDMMTSGGGQEIAIGLVFFLTQPKRKPEGVRCNRAFLPVLFILCYLPQQFLYFLPLPHGQGSFLPIFLP